jgi:glycosyltransferase involved in cell wall biosynthesis
LAAQVAVVMPCRNAGPAVDQAIASIVGGTLEAFEFIAVDDGSTDDTAARLATWAKRDARLRLIQLPRVGLVEALNVGCQAASAPLLARMDADDVALPTRLEKQLTLLQASPDLAVVGAWVRAFPEGEVRQGFRLYVDWLNSLTTPESIAREIFVESPLAHPSVMMRANWIERIGGYQDHGWPEDYDLWLRLHLAGARFGKVPEVLLLWREHPTRATRTLSRYSVENFLRAKAMYLAQGPLVGRDGVILWGAGQMGKRLSKHLLKLGLPLAAFIDVDPKKIGRQRRGLPIEPVEALDRWWGQFARPAVLAAVGSRGARGLIRAQLNAHGLIEGQDWWAVA